MRTLAASLLAALLLLVPAQPLLAQQAPTAADPATQQLVSKIETYMNAAHRVNQFSGSVLVARDGKPVLVRGYGYANVELGVPNTPQTVFRIGSITKSFTAVAMLMLQQDGKLLLSDSICKYLDDCPATWKPVTIHHLLTHTAGIRNFTELATYRQTQMMPVTHQGMMARLKDLPLDFMPGEKAAYNNSAFYLAGMIIEQVSGKSYREFLQQRVFTPLTMSNSGYDDGRRIIKGRAAGYELGDGVLLNASHIDMSLPYASGSLYSTVEDLLLFDQALYTDTFLTRKSRDQMFKAYAQSRGYGWTVRERLGRPNIEKDGGIDGFQSVLSRFPDDRTTIIVLGNNGSVSATKMANDLAAVIYDAPYELPRERRPITLDAETLRRYTGRYRLSSGNHVTITLEDGKLFRTGDDGSKRELVPESTTRFFVNGRDVFFIFQLAEDGVPTRLVIHANGRDNAGERIP